ncbi:uncharacterized protein LOC120989079 [Bufo bufo]|uniref:uncharacterized protein LOC120989079 n=1 Tax=Bufo bufo TaxID=8384 RepID=UPI001ABEBA2E|nr:uncharacterized protein LOC120989079 [Bufo bufo]
MDTVEVKKREHHKNSGPVQNQPEWRGAPVYSHQNQTDIPIAVVPPGLECLVKVNKVILHKKAFFTRSGRTLFTIHWPFECCGPGFNLRVRDHYKRNVMSLCADSGENCFRRHTNGWSVEVEEGTVEVEILVETVKEEEGGESVEVDEGTVAVEEGALVVEITVPEKEGTAELKIVVLPARTIGFVTISHFSSKMSVSIQMTCGEPAFTAELPFYCTQNIIEILSVKGSCPVAKIIKEGETTSSSKVIFKFPKDMEATLKAVILAAFLYMKYQLKSFFSTSYSYDGGWGTVGGLSFYDGGKIIPIT